MIIYQFVLGARVEWATPFEKNIDTFWPQLQSFLRGE
jgi:hypothetical protein